MKSKFIISFLLLLAMGTNAKKLPLGQPRPYIMGFNLDFKEDKITDFIAESLFVTNGWMTSERPYCDIKLFDILSIIPFKKTTSVDINAAIDKLNLQINDDDLSSFIQNLDYTQLSYMGFNVGGIYKNFIKTYLTINPTQIIDVLNALGIGPEFAVAYAFGTDAEMFNALQKGNFSTTALSEIEAIINTKLTFKDMVKIFAIKKTESFYFQQFVNDYLTNYLAAKNLQLTNFVNFLNSFTLKFDNYKSMRSFKTCYKTLTQDVTLGVAVGNYEVITNDDSILQTHMALETFTTFTVSAVQTKLVYPLNQIKAPQNNTNLFLTLEVAAPFPEYIEKATSYENVNTKMCTYITIGNKKLLEQPTSVSLVDGKLEMSKTLSITFKKGSPLICEGLLFGLAAEETMFTINFDTFEKESKPSINNIAENPEFMQAMSNLFEQFDINPCHYFSCSPSVPTINDGFVVVPSINIDTNEFQVIDENIPYEGDVQGSIEENSEEVEVGEDETYEEEIIDGQIREDQQTEQSGEAEEDYQSVEDQDEEEQQTIERWEVVEAQHYLQQQQTNVDKQKENREETTNEVKLVEGKEEILEAKNEQNVVVEVTGEAIIEDVKTEAAFAEEQRSENEAVEQGKLNSVNVDNEETVADSVVVTDDQTFTEEQVGVEGKVAIEDLAEQSEVIEQQANQVVHSEAKEVTENQEKNIETINEHVAVDDLVPCGVSQNTESSFTENNGKEIAEESQGAGDHTQQG